MIKRVDNGGQVHLVTNIRKPRKWRRYEYLLSSGTLYIDTGIPYDSTDSTYKIECKFSLPSNIASYDAIFGAYTDESSKTLRIIRGNNNSIMWSYYNTKAGGGVCGRIETANSNIREVILTSTLTVVTENGTTTTYTHPSVNGNNTTSKFYLFCQGIVNGALSCLSSSRIYYFKLYDYGTLIKHFVPAQYNGQYGMWDLVEDKFYPNKGTGTFTVGPEMKNYDEIYEVRKTTSLLPSGVELYNYILSSGTLWIDTQFSSNQMDKFVVNYTATANSGYILHNGTTQIEIYSTRYGNNSLNTNYTMLGVKNSEQKWTITNLNNNTLYLNNWTGYNHSEPDYLFALAPGAGNNATGLKIYYYKTYLNGVLLRNFIPCTYLGEPGMWDTVENKFYRNQGTGLFTLGNKITLKEYEYLLNDANSYIDTKYIPNTHTHIKTKVQFSTIGSGKFFVYGGADTTYNNKAFELYDWGSKLLFNYGNLTNAELVPTINTWLEIEHNRNQVNCNGLSKTITANTFTSPKTMCLYAINRTSGVTKSPNAHKIQYFKIWDNDILARDFIPVSYNGTPGLWDKVEWKFYGNAGSGSFTLGPEKKSGIYPVWTPIEYLLSDNNSYINTTYVPNGNTRVITDIMILDSNSQNKGIFGSFPTNTWADRSYALYLYSSNNLWNNYNNDKNLGSSYYSIMLNNITHIDKNKNVLYINNGIAYQDTKVTFDSNVPMHIFRVNKPTVFYSKFKLYYFKIYDDDVLVRDFIPIRIGTTGALYDKVEGKVYFNSGTGNFTLGPDL